MDREELKKEMIKWRRHFHKNPESAFEEVNTSNYIANLLQEMGYKVTTGIGKTGLIADLKLGTSEKIIGLRADMDCIELDEKLETEYKSVNKNRMHACGHDGHMATLLGTAKILSKEKNFDGTVRLVFQPAEEPGKGAKEMVKDGLFTKYRVDEIYGLHNMPGLEEGKIYTKVGSIMGSEDDFVIKIHGKGSHASAPNMSIDPLVIAANIILALQTIVARNVSPTDTAVVSCTELHTDGIRNAIPSNVIIKGDTRSFSKDVQILLEKRMEELVKNICLAYGADYEFEYTHEFSPTVNHKEQTEVAIKAAENILGKENVVANCQPTMISEDFGYFLTKIPGCFVFLGGAKKDKEVIALHNSMYNYNEDILIKGAEFFAEIIRIRLKK